MVKKGRRKKKRERKYSVYFPSLRGKGEEKEGRDRNGLHCFDYSCGENGGEGGGGKVSLSNNNNRSIIN